ncbi:MAG: type IVB secretion system protein IcmV [Gammaproteobacteria bacterium]|nr:type IVB secretion system protein IcmV [Gammaproteobacteria bacterium]
MAKKKRVRKFLASLYNVKKWVGYDSIKEGANVLIKSYRTITSPEAMRTKYPTEKFQNAVERLNLSETDVAEIESGYFRNFFVFFFIGVIIAAYSIYRFYLGHWLSGWISLMMTIVLFTFSLASHFWYFQVKNRKLGCTMKEWSRNKIS